MEGFFKWYFLVLYCNDLCVYSISQIKVTEIANCSNIYAKSTFYLQVSDRKKH